MHVLRVPMNISSVVLKTRLTVLLGTMSKPVVLPLPILLRLPSSSCFVTGYHEGNGLFETTWVGKGEFGGQKTVRYHEKVSVQHRFFPKGSGKLLVQFFRPPPTTAPCTLSHVGLFTLLHIVVQSTSSFWLYNLRRLHEGPFCLPTISWSHLSHILRVYQPKLFFERKDVLPAFTNIMFSFEKFPNSM